VTLPRRIVALAGTLCSPRIFDPFAERLDGVASVEAVSWMTLPGPWDIPSIASRLAAHVATTATAPVTLIGHSTGGAIAQQLVLDHPELFDSLALIDTGANMHAHGDVDAIIANMERSWGPSLFGAILDRSFAEPLDATSRALFLDYAGTVELAAARDVLVSQRAIDFASRLGEIACPTVVIHGTQDPTRTVASAEEFAERIPGSRLVLLDCGHSPMFEQPDATADILRTLLFDA
jgi:pimeloyl-ACP methyl ester carboxylesterase